MSNLNAKFIEERADQLLASDLPGKYRQAVLDIKSFAHNVNSDYEDLEEQLAIIEQLGYQDNS